MAGTVKLDAYVIDVSTEQVERAVKTAAAEKLGGDKTIFEPVKIEKDGYGAYKVTFLRK